MGLPPVRGETPAVHAHDARRLLQAVQGGLRWMFEHPRHCGSGSLTCATRRTMPRGAYSINPRCGLTVVAVVATRLSLGFAVLPQLAKGMLEYNSKHVPKSLVLLNDESAETRAVVCNSYLHDFTNGKPGSVDAARGLLSFLGEGLLKKNPFVVGCLLGWVPKLDVRRCSHVGCGACWQDELYMQLCKHWNGVKKANVARRTGIAWCWTVDVLVPSDEIAPYVTNFLISKLGYAMAGHGWAGLGWALLRHAHPRTRGVPFTVRTRTTCTRSTRCSGSGSLSMVTTTTSQAKCASSREWKTCWYGRWPWSCGRHAARRPCPAGPLYAAFAWQASENLTPFVCDLQLVHGEVLKHNFLVPIHASGAEV